MQGVKDAMNYLIELGHRTIWHVAGPADSYPTFVRQKAWEEALSNAGLPPGRVLRGDWTIDSGYAVGLELSRQLDCTAIFCANDEMAMGVMRAFAEKGIRVPEDVSIVGFDGEELSKFTAPPLTTIRQAFKRVAQIAVDRLMQQIQGEPLSLVPELTPTDLIVRASTGPPPTPRA